MKTCVFLVSTGFLVSDIPYLVIQKSLTLSNIYPNFLLFFQSRVPLIFQSGTLVIPNSNSDARRLQFLMHGYHVTCVRNAQWSYDFHSSSAALS